MFPLFKQIVEKNLLFPKNTTALIILTFFIIGCGTDSEFKNPCPGSWISRCGGNTEILIIGPYRTECPSFSGSDCYLEFNEESQRWFFFYDGIRGFDFEPGFIWTLKVSLHEYSGDIQDVGKYEYRLIEVLSKEEASVDERPPRIPN
ncbi:hypothetical protein C6500_11580 [Candidatus Poribacteria bacterium]|nr:MAG: hypothetical protein C6500_11580 [Candidatus Poribacteria bacterium]